MVRWHSHSLIYGHVTTYSPMLYCVIISLYDHVDTAIYLMHPCNGKKTLVQKATIASSTGHVIRRMLLVY